MDNGKIKKNVTILSNCCFVLLLVLCFNHFRLQCSLLCLVLRAFREHFTPCKSWESIRDHSKEKTSIAVCKQSLALSHHYIRKESRLLLENCSPNFLIMLAAGIAKFHHQSLPMWVSIIWKNCKGLGKPVYPHSGTGPSLCPQLFFFFWFGFYGPSRLFHSFWAESIERWGENGRFLRKTISDHPQAELGLSHMWPELGLNPQRWDEERYRLVSLTTRPWELPPQLWFDVP